jgi:hypothetical protein
MNIPKALLSNTRQILMGIPLKGFTHIFFGIGFVGILLCLFEIPIFLWMIGTLVFSPIFSRLPDQDQKISKLTFNQIVPHRGKGTHNLLYGLPLILTILVNDLPIVGSFLLVIIVGIFGSLFAHAFIDGFNYGGIWFGIFHIKIGRLRWDSFWGNLGFKLIGILLFLIALLSYFLS